MVEVLGRGRFYPRAVFSRAVAEVGGFSQTSEAQMIVIEQQNKIEVFRNESGSVSIMEFCYPDDNQVIAIPLDKVPALISALQLVAKEAGE